MKIMAVRLREVGLFREPVAIEGFSGKLDVLAGDNEFGKSTIFRALKTVLLEKHTATGKTVRDLKPRVGGAPLVEVDFERGGETWRITKQFGRTKKAELRCLSGDGAIFRGPDAEDRLGELIGVDGLAPPGRFNLLWVAQKHGFARPDLDFDPIGNKKKDRGEKSVITTAIESEVSEIAGGPLARGVSRRVFGALENLVTSRGAKKGGPLDLALRERDEVSGRLENARELADRTSTWMEELGRARERSATLKAPGRVEKMGARASELRLKLSDASKAVHQRKSVSAERAVALEKLGNARSLLQLFDSDLEELSEHDKCARAGAQILKQLEKEFALADAALEDSKKSVARLQGDSNRLSELLVARAQFDRRAQSETTLGARSQALDVAKALERSIAAGRDELRDNPLTSALMEELNAFEREVRVGEGQLAASAPTVDIALEAGGGGRISVDGAKVESNSDYIVAKPMTIKVDGVGTIMVAPGKTTGRDALEARLTGQRGALGKLLDTVGAPDISSARARFKDRDRIKVSMREAVAKFEAVAPDGFGKLEEEVLRLKADLGEASGEPRDAPPPAGELRTRLGEIGVEHETVNATFERNRSTRDEMRDKVNALKAEAGARETRLGALVEKLGGEDVRASKRLQLNEAVSALNEVALACERAVEALPEPPDQAARDVLTAQVAQADEAVKTQARETSEVRAVISKLEGQIQVADDEGAGVRVAQVSGELERAQAQVSRIEADVLALQLLQRELAGAAEVAKAQISAPLMKRLAPYLSLLFPDAKVSIGEGLRLEGLERGEVVEELGTLSDGTLEQLAIVVRLAYARLLAETGSEVPLFLDDPLAYSDEQRLERVFEALRLGAQSHQVIVFTCRGNAFASLAGNRLKLSAWENAP